MAEEGWTWRSWVGLIFIGMFLYRCASGGDKPAEPPAEAPAAAPTDTPSRATRPSRAAVTAPAAAEAPPYEPPPLLDPTPPSPGPRLAGQDTLQEGVSRLPTSAGMLSVQTSGGEQLLELDGVPLAGPAGAAIRLVHRASFVDREVVTGFSGCRSLRSGCRPDRPFYVLMREGLPARVLQAEGIAVTDGFGAVTADATGVSVDLGVDRGTQWRSTLTARDGIHIASGPAQIRPLDSLQCAQVSLALRECSLAETSSCGVPGASAAQLTAARRSALTTLFHETTGFDERRFLELCSVACSERAPPSPERIAAEACAGAEAGQWAAPSLPWLPGARPPPPVPAPVDTPPRLDISRSPSTDDFYPDEARRRQMEGTSLVSVCADAEGRVDGTPVVSAASGLGVLDEAAVRWASQVRFTPATRAGTPVAACTRLLVRFRLQE